MQQWVRLWTARASRVGTLLSLTIATLMSIPTCCLQPCLAKEPEAPAKALPRSSTCLDEIEKEKQAGISGLPLAPKLIDLGNAYRREGATMEAIPVYEEALAIYGKAKMLGCQRALECQLTLGEFYEDSGRDDKSERSYSTALASAGQNSVAQEQILPKLTAVMVKQGQLAAAEPIFKRWLTLGEKHYGTKDPRLVPILQQYAGTLTQLKRLPEANKLTARAQSILEAARSSHTKKQPSKKQPSSRRSRS